VTLLLDIELERIGLPVGDTDHPGIGEGRRQGRRIAQTGDPAEALFLLLRGFLLAPRLRGLELRLQHSQRQPVGVHRQRRVQMQPQTLGTGLVAAHDPEAARLRVGGEVQIGAILQAQHRRLRLHPALRARPMRRQDVLRRDLGIRRLVDQPVVALHRRPVVAGHRGKGAQRILPLALGTVHQPFRQSLVPQGRAPELVRGPLLRIQTFGGFQRRVAPRRRRTHPQPCAPIGFECIEIDRLAGLRRGVAGILATPSTGLAHTTPVRRPQADPGVRGLDEGLHQPGTIAVAGLEVSRQPPQRPTQRPRGEVPTGHTRTQQEPVQPHHTVPVAFPQRRVPADPGIPGRQLQRRRGKPQRPQPALRRTHQIAHLCAHQRPRSTRVLAHHQLVPERPVLGIVHPYQLQARPLGDRAAHPLGCRHGLSQAPALAPAPRRAARRRQRHLPCAFQSAQRLQAAPGRHARTRQHRDP
jgi:hypothetical protein